MSSESEVVESLNESSYSSTQVKIIALNAEIGVLTKILDGLEAGSQAANTFTLEVAKKKEEVFELSVDLAKNPPSSQPPSTTPDYGRMHMLSAQVALMKMFKGQSSDECNNFVTGFRQIKSSFDVSDDELIKYAKSKMSPNCFRFLESYEDENGTFSSFNGFCDFIKKQWGGHLSVYQTLETAFALNRKDKETWSQFCISLTQAMSKVKLGHAELLKSKSKTVTIDSVFDMFTNSIMLANINSVNHELYRAITAEIKDLVTPNQLASRAASLEVQGNYSAHSASSVLFGNKTTLANKQPQKDRRFEAGKGNKGRTGKKNYPKGKPSQTNGSGLGDSNKCNTDQNRTQTNRSTYFTAQDWEFSDPCMPEVQEQTCKSGPKNSK